MLMALETDMPRVSRTLSACSLTSGSIRAYKFAVLFISINIHICPHKCNTFFLISQKRIPKSKEKAFWDGEENLKTEHEKMFEADGIKIKALIATK